MSGNPKIVICRNCNSTISKNAIICPHCGAKNKKPFYKRVWFVILIVFIIFILLVTNNKDKVEKVDWKAEIELADKLPEPKSDKVIIFSNSNDHLSVEISDVVKSDYVEYLDECETLGYTVESEKKDTSYTAYNSDGYKLSINYYDVLEEMQVMLDTPMELGTLQWPANELVNLLPVPKSEVGLVTKDSSDKFYVYIGETSKDDYYEYVNECMDNGFNVNYDRGEKYFDADNAEGFHLSVDYHGFNIIRIEIDKPEEVTSETEVVDETPVVEVEDTKDDVATSEKTEEPETDLNADFKEAMDSYEKFMSEYVGFMKKYNANPTDISLLMDVANYTSDYAEFVAKFEAIGSSDMNVAEAAYYLEVQARVTKMLLEVMP